MNRYHGLTAGFEAGEVVHDLSFGRRRRPDALGQPGARPSAERLDRGRVARSIRCAYRGPVDVVSTTSDALADVEVSSLSRRADASSEWQLLIDGQA